MPYPFSSSGAGRRDVVGVPGRLWKRIPAEHRLEACTAFWQEEGADEQQAEALLVVASHYHFRPKSIRSLPTERKARYLSALPGVPDSVAGRVLVAYHLARQRPMLSAFLDALGIAHENGVLAGEELTAPAPDRLAEAAAKLRAAFPPADVDLYFETLIGQDPDTWGGLEGLLGGETHSEAR